MKKGICFVMTVALCAMLLTACGNGSGQTGNAGAGNSTERSSTVQSAGSGNQDNEVITGTEVQSGITDTADNGQAAESTGSGQQKLSEGNIMDLERAAQIGTVTAGTEYDEDFLIDNVLFFNNDRGVSNQHVGGGLFAADDAIMGWLFEER